MRGLGARDEVAIGIMGIRTFGLFEVQSDFLIRLQCSIRAFDGIERRNNNNNNSTQLYTLIRYIKHHIAHGHRASNMSNAFLKVLCDLISKIMVLLGAQFAPLIGKY